MRPDVAAALVKSSATFRDLVWPIVSTACGGGELVPVETVTEAAFSQQLDVLAGIDAWQIIQPRGMRGIASRVQPQERAWDTFTIRWRLRSGSPTEIHKRWLALVNGYLYPELWAHAYVDPTSARVLSVAVMRTRPLIEMAGAWTVAHQREPDLWKTRDGMYVKDVTGGNQMLVVPWDLVADQLLILWHDGDPHPSTPGLWQAA